MKVGLTIYVNGLKFNSLLNKLTKDMVEEVISNRRQNETITLLDSR